MPLFAVYSLILRLASGNWLASIRQLNAFAYSSHSGLSTNPHLVQLRSDEVPDLRHAHQHEDDDSYTFERGILHVVTKDEEEERDRESAIDQAESPSLFPECSPEGMKHALSIQYSPRIPFTKRIKEPIPQIFQLGPQIIEIVESHDGFDSPHNPSVASNEIQFHDVFDFQPLEASVTNEVFIVSDEQIEILFLRHQAGKAETLSLRQWLANFLLCSLLRRDEGNPVPYSLANQTAIAHLADNIFDFFWYGYGASDELAFLATQYVSYLLPTGLLEAKDLYSPYGVVAATRLFVLTYTLAIKNVEDRAYRLNKWTSYYGTKFEPLSATRLEISALQALDFNIVLQPDQWMAHLRHLYGWTSEPRSHFQEAHLIIHARIGAVYSAAAYSPTTTKERALPSESSLDRVYESLLDGLDMRAPRLPFIGTFD